MNPWQAHDEAKHAATAQIEDFMIALHRMEEKAQDVAGYVAVVTGGELCPNSNGRSAWEHIASVPAKFDEARALCLEAIVQLDAYIF
jgi:hypothetical protein